MKKTARKVLLMACSALLLVCLTVGATVAYLTANTVDVVNTFTVGKVEIDLDETDVDVYGDKDGDNPVKKNEYKLINGHTYTKDPTVHVKKGSEPCYVFVKVVNNIVNSEIKDDPDTTDVDESKNTIAAQMEANGWVSMGNDIYYYNGTEHNAEKTEGVVDALNEAKDLPVFGTFTIDGNADLTAIDIDKDQITIDAYAIQADGFDTATDAWDAAKTWQD